MDLKPQNILLSDDGNCRLADFGLSRKIPPGQKVCEISGTPEYTAPEILDYSPVTPAADIWSLGCVIYVMLTGLSPFAGEDIQDTYLNVSQVDLDFDDEEWEDKSQASIDLISSLCQARPNNRPEAKEVLEHVWLSTNAPLRSLRPVEASDECELILPTQPTKESPPKQAPESVVADEIIVKNRRTRRNRRSQQELEKNNIDHRREAAAH
ncbi:Oidioi.mRNA.OKI2018_I69.XSR.g15128.t1.cds [Oikopleura dioica]|uniref:Oidioi.mRNA.OKI2018_I69.XSR.g15128.t1.cds n=1 Tax=Oikopleura dioica TaxID=34765 RepID=A0ABN7SKZ8_OIKDI|nr:Oidioi.mRNA.OKI2018_I69.XSR.g15128.t1.cds [Oikopleura dioica]